jgi:hypothetical protein
MAFVLVAIQNGSMEESTARQFGESRTAIRNLLLAKMLANSPATLQAYSGKEISI